MFEILFAALMDIFSWPAFGFMLLAALIAIVIGVIPGLGGYFLLAVLIPFAFRLEVLPALVFLLTAHGVVETGGAVSAILFNTPGTGQNIATTFDGYALTQKGKGGRAIGAALTASGLGGMIGAIVYLLMLPLIRPIILSLGSGDFFVLVTLGIVCVGGLLGKEPVKGLMMGCLGLVMSSVGQDPVVGTIRFDFGQMYLWDGVPLIAVVIGLVAVSEMIRVSVRGGTIARVAIDSKEISRLIGKDMLQGVLDTFRHWWLNLRCSILGFIIGFIPGLGGQAASFMAYGYAARTSKDPDSFGKGNIEGVIAPESANNSGNGGSLLPTLAFGVPGSGGFAIILGVLIMLGVVPGATMFTKNLKLTITLGWTLAIGNLVAAILGFFTVRPLIRLTFVRAALLVCPILIVAVIGGYVATYSFGDIIVVYLFAILGFCMKKFGYPTPPLVLGLVLGELAEVNLNVALQAYGPAFLIIRPVTAGLTFLVVLFGVWPFLKKLFEKRGRN